MEASRLWLLGLRCLLLLLLLLLGEVEVVWLAGLVLVLCLVLLRAVDLLPVLVVMFCALTAVCAGRDITSDHCRVEGPDGGSAAADQCSS